MIKRLGKYNARWLLAILVYIAAFSVLAGCSGKEEGTSHLSAPEVGEQIKRVVKLDDMKEGDAHKLEKLYQIKAEEVDSFILYTAATNMKASELSVIKAKDANQAESIKKKILKRVELQGVKFKDYRPDEFFLVEKHVLKTNGSYILFVVSKEAEQMENAFDKALK